MHLITNLSDIFLDSKFINGSIFQVLKLHFFRIRNFLGFMMTQFFQVLKPAAAEVSEECFMMTQFFQVLKPYPQSIFSLFSFMMTQFFQVLKREKGIDGLEEGFMMTQFFQVLKLQPQRRIRR